MIATYCLSNIGRENAYTKHIVLMSLFSFFFETK